MLDAAADIASSGDGKSRKMAPKAEEWEPYVAKALSYISVLYVWWLLEGDPSEPDAFDRYGNDLKLDDERAAIIAKPLVRLVAASVFNKKYGRDVLDNGDLMLAAIALATYVNQTRSLLRDKLNRSRAPQHAAPTSNNIYPTHMQRQNVDASGGANGQQGSRGSTQDAPASNGHGGIPAGWDQFLNGRNPAAEPD